MLSFYKDSCGKNISHTENLEKTLSPQEVDALHYLGGYVIHNLHRKLKNSSKWNEKESQVCMAILQAAKITNDYHSQDQPSTSTNLVDALQRGGLWKLKLPAINVFRIVEKTFRKYTGVCGQRSINVDLIVTNCVKDSEVYSIFNTIVESSELNCVEDKHFISDLLTSIIKLYVKVRSFSYAKDIIQKFKVKDKSVKDKAKALRKELKRSSEKPDEQK